MTDLWPEHTKRIGRAGDRLPGTVCLILGVVWAAVAAGATPTYGADVSAHIPDPSLISLQLFAGVSRHSWNPGLSGNFLEFETEGLQALRAGLGIAWHGRPLFRLQYAGTLKSTSRQQEMLAASRDETSTVQEMLGFLDLLSILMTTQRYQMGQIPFLERLLAVKLIYFEDLYHARTVSTQPFVYFPFGSGVDLSTDPGEAYGFVEYDAGQILSFKTSFRDFHIMLPVWVDAENRRLTAHLGYFRSRWQKVAENVDFLLEDDPILQDSRFDTQGLSLMIEDDLTHGGFGWSAGGDWGLFDSTLESPISYSDRIAANEAIYYFAWRLEARVNFTSATRRHGFGASLGARVESRFWSVYRGVEQANGDVEIELAKKLDKDVLYRIYGSVSFDLGL